MTNEFIEYCTLDKDTDYLEVYFYKEGEIVLGVFQENKLNKVVFNKKKTRALIKFLDENLR